MLAADRPTPLAHGLPMHVAISLGNADVAPAPGVTNDDIHRIHMDLARRLFEQGLRA